MTPAPNHCRMRASGPPSHAHQPNALLRSDYLLQADLLIVNFPEARFWTGRGKTEWPLDWSRVSENSSRGSMFAEHLGHTHPVFPPEAVVFLSGDHDSFNLDRASASRLAACCHSEKPKPLPECLRSAESIRKAVLVPEQRVQLFLWARWLLCLANDRNPRQLAGTQKPIRFLPALGRKPGLNCEVRWRLEARSGVQKSQGTS